MIRAANTGVSAVIDAYGRVLASLDMEQEGIIDHRLPAARAATPYARWGDWTLLASGCISVRDVARQRDRGTADNAHESFDISNAEVQLAFSGSG